MSNISAIVAGAAFVTLAAANVVMMLEASQPSRSTTIGTRLIAVHRVGGYLFVILLCIMAYGMSQRLAGLGITGHLPTHLVRFRQGHSKARAVQDQQRSRAALQSHRKSRDGNNAA
jgi:hypothetical protein